MQLYDSGEFRASDKWPYAISAGCVVYRFSNQETEVLLLKRNPGHTHNHVRDAVTHNLPKGHLKFGDSLEATAIRETKEEAGCEVDLRGYLGVVTREFVHPYHQVKNNKTTHYFAALWQNDLHSIDSEHDVRAWFNIDEAYELLASKNNPKGEYEIIRRLKKFLELTNAA